MLKALVFILFERIAVASALTMLTSMISPTTCKAGQISFFNTANGLPHTNIQALVEDDLGFLWLLCPSGIFRFDGQQFQNYSNGLAEYGVIHDLAFWNKNHLLLATDKGIVFYRLPHCSLNLADAGLKVGFAFEKIPVYQIDSKRNEGMLYQTAHSQINFATDFTQHQASPLVALRIARVARQTAPVSLNYSPLNPSQSSNRVNIEQKGRQLFVDGATHYPAANLNEKELTEFRNASLHTASTQDGVLWLFSDLGLAIAFNPKKQKAEIERWTLSPSLNRLPKLKDSFFDSHNRLWLIAEGGLIRILPKETVSVDYLPVKQANKPSALSPPLAKQGNLLARMGAYLSAAEAGKQAHLKRIATPYMMVDYIAPNQQLLPLDARSRLSFSHRQYPLSFVFSAINHQDHPNIVYFFRIKGRAETDWQPIMPQEKILSVHPLSGDYSIAIKAEINTSLYPIAYQEFAFRIARPFIQTWWFYILVILFIFLMFVFVFKYRIRQIKSVEETRNEISRHLHDDIGASLSAINLLNAHAISKLSEKDPVKPHLSKAGKEIQKVNNALQDIIKAVNPKSDELSLVFAQIREHGATVFEAKGIDYKIELPTVLKKIYLPMTRRTDLFLIFKEAVNNIVKYANCTQVEVKITFHNGYITMVINDNGIGFDRETLSRTRGLINMETRAKRLKGELFIVSELGVGTRVWLRFPLYI